MARKRYLPPMMIYGRPSEIPGFLLLGGLVAAAALLPLLGIFA